MVTPPLTFHAVLAESPSEEILIEMHQSAGGGDQRHGRVTASWRAAYTVLEILTTQASEAAFLPVSL